MKYLLSKLEAIKKSAFGLLASYAVFMIVLTAIIRNEFLVLFSVISTLILAIAYIFWSRIKAIRSADFKALSEELSKDKILFVQEILVKNADMEKTGVFEISQDGGKTWKHHTAGDGIYHCGTLVSRKMLSGCWITFDEIRGVYYLFG